MEFCEKTYRDPVHNIISLDKRSSDDMVLSQLIDSSEMQRLRYIRQLGLASCAYPGAEHSRFAHSIGVCWLATKILTQLNKIYPISAENQLAVRCAALLHDVGHGPFSHVLEGITTTSHETWSVRIITDSQTQVSKILSRVSEDFPDKVRSMLEHQSNPGFLSEIISSQLDADRFDYLLRDSMMTGVKHGIFDLESILALLRVDQKGEHIILNEIGVHPVEKYLQSRYHMFSLVYLHRTVRAAENMLRVIFRRAMELLKEGGGEEAGIACKGSALWNLLCSGVDVELSDYLSINDSTVNYHLQQWTKSSDHILSDLSQRVLNRMLFKSIDISNVEDLRGKLQGASEIISLAGADSNYYFLLDETSSVPYKPYDPQHGVVPHGTHILIQTPGGLSEYVDIYDLSPVVKGLTQARISSRRVYFPDVIFGQNIRGEMEHLFLGETKNLF